MKRLIVSALVVFGLAALSPGVGAQEEPQLLVLSGESTSGEVWQRDRRLMESNFSQHRE